MDLPKKESPIIFAVKKPVNGNLDLENNSYAEHHKWGRPCLFFLVCLGILFAASSSFGQKGLGIGQVEGIKANSITISFSGLRKRSFERNQFLDITAQIPINLTDFEIGDPVMVRGHRQRVGRIKALVVVKLSIFQKKLRGYSTMTFGRVVSLSPFIIETDNQNRIKVNISDVTSLLVEERSSFSQIEIGSSVVLRNRSLIILLSSLNDKNRKHHSSIPRGATKPMGKFPSPPEQYISHFDANLVKRKLGSPFGFFDPNQLRFTPLLWNDHFPETMRDLGVHWALSGASFSFTWKRIQARKKNGELGSYDWHRMDRLVGYYFANNIIPVGMIIATEPLFGDEEEIRRTPSLPDDLSGYQRFVQAIVERYDYDGFNDMPGLPMAIKNWVIENEPISPKYFEGSGADYAVILKNAWQAIKAADPDATVITSMVRGTGRHAKVEDPRAFMVSFFKKLATLGGERPYDAIDQHWIGFDPKKSLVNQYGIYEKWLTDITETSAQYGFAKVPFMALEMAGRQNGEQEHAEDILKRHVYMLALGVRKIFWSGIRAAPDHLLSAERQNSYFRQVVLINEDGVKKKGYYTYRFMVEMLEGADWRKIRLTADDSGLILVRFQKEGLPLWVAWNDGSGKKNYSLTLPTRARKVRIVKGIPGLKSNETSMENGSAFGIVVIDATKGQVEVSLDKTPIYIVPLYETEEN